MIMAPHGVGAARGREEISVWAEEEEEEEESDRLNEKRGSTRLP